MSNDTQTGYSVRWAATHIGGSQGEWLSDGGWEDDGFYVEDGKPVQDNRGNTVSKHSEEAFDPGNEDHVRMAVAYATSDGGSREGAVEFLSSLAIPMSVIDEQLGGWPEDED